MNYIENNPLTFFRFFGHSLWITPAIYRGEQWPSDPGGLALVASARGARPKAARIAKKSLLGVSAIY
ncbi:hypothetical protein UA24_19830 [Marinomonas sp. BSi20414]|nr:hypothetical protein [Marinomonas sp. BSi20414]